MCCRLLTCFTDMNLSRGMNRDLSLLTIMQTSGFSPTLSSLGTLGQRKMAILQCAISREILFTKLPTLLASSTVHTNKPSHNLIAIISASPCVHRQHLVVQEPLYLEQRHHNVACDTFHRTDKSEEQIVVKVSTLKQSIPSPFP